MTDNAWRAKWGTLTLALVAGCGDATSAPVPPPTPAAQLVDAITALNIATEQAHRAGYRVMITVYAPDTLAPRVGVVLYPR